jgi:hypothetical protein
VECHELTERQCKDNQRALANQSSPAQQALLQRKRTALDATHAITVFGSDRPGGTAELRVRLEGYWTHTLESLKARLENAPEEGDSDCDESKRQASLRNPRLFSE